MSDGEARYFPDVVARIVGPWRDAGPDGPTGRVVVVSGTPQSGRSTVLSQVAADLRHAGVHVVRREGRGGSLRPVDETGVGEHVVQGSKVLAAALQVAGAGAVGDLVALAAEIATTHGMADALDAERPPGDAYVAVGRVAAAVEQRAAREPLALVVDDADRLDAPEVWWDALFATRLPRLAGRLPVLVVLGVERTSTAASHALEVVDTRLVPARLAEEIRVPALDPARIADALGAVDDALLAQLRPLVQGRPGWLDEIWATWRAGGVVVRRDGRWTVAPDARDRVRTSLHGWVESALHASAPAGDGFWRAKEIVETAALEGPRFTVEALAEVLGDDVQDLIDWIDEHLADAGGPALLADDGFVPRAAGVEPPELRCYRFRSALVAGVLRQETLAGTSGKLLAGRYARALARAYQHSSVSGIAWTIGRLARTADDRELEEYVWRRANRLEGVEAAARLARFLVEHLDADGTSVEERAGTVERLNGLTGQLVGRWNAVETLELCRAVERSARGLPATDGRVAPERTVGLLLDAVERRGQAALDAGETDEAVAALGEAADTAAGWSDHVRTARAYLRLANAEHLGWGGDPARLTVARAHVTTALEYACRGASRAALLAKLGCLNLMASLAEASGDRPGVLDAVRRSATVLLDPAFRHGLLAGNVFGCLRAAAGLALVDGERAAEAAFRAAAVRCGAPASEVVVAFNHLGVVRQRLGDLPGAVLAHCRELRLAQDIHAEREGAALLSLAYRARDLGVPLAASLAVLADPRIGRSTWLFVQARALHADFGDVVAEVDDATRHQIEHDYRADRGARLLRAAFGVDVAEIDARNERLGDATEDEMRGFLLDVQRYVTG